MTDKKESTNKFVETEQESRKDRSSRGSTSQKQQESSIPDKSRNVKTSGDTSNIRSREKLGKPILVEKSRTSKKVIS